MKTRRLKSRKIDSFPEGLPHAFGRKVVIFSTFFLGSFSQENVFYDILERVRAFLALKKKKFKKSKNRHFSKGVYPWFWSKNGDFSVFIF